jgi:phage terminase large subunit-like protein
VTAAAQGAKRAARRRTDRRRAATGFRYSATGARFGLFAFLYLRHTKGRWAGKPLALEPWQLETYSELLQVESDVWRDLTIGDLEKSPDDFWSDVQEWLVDGQAVEAAGLRVHREGLIGTPKKNSKSTGAAGLMLYLVEFDDEAGAEVFSLASSKDQARIVFSVARTMVESSPKLLERLAIGRGYTRTVIEGRNGGVYKVISADADLQEGINPHGASVDEIHTHPSRALYDTVRSAMVAREQPLQVGLTTAGVTFKAKGGGELNLLGDLYQRGGGKRPKFRLRKLNPELARFGHKTELVEIVPRPDKSRRFYFKWFEVPWAHRENPRYWLAANPIAYMNEELLRDEADVERPRGIFYRYHLNITTAVEKHWLPPGKLEKTRAPGLRLDRDEPVVVTIDVGLSYDTTAVTLTRPAPAGERLVTRSLVLGVHDNPKAPPPPAHLLQSEGPIDLDEIRDIVRAVSTGDYDGELRAELAEQARETFGMAQGEPLTVVIVAADPHKFETQLQDLDDEGLQVMRFSQGDPMTLASDALYREITSKEVPLATSGDEVLEVHLENAAARDVGGGKWRLDKKRAEDKMDAAVSTAMGVYLARDPEIATPPRPGLTLL